MERTVLVKGIELTKDELTEALERINKPEFKPGDIVRFKTGHSMNDRFVVVHPAVNRVLNKEWRETGPNVVRIIGLSDGNSYAPTAKSIELTGEVL